MAQINLEREQEEESYVVDNCFLAEDYARGR